MPSRPHRVALCSIALGALAIVLSAACTFPTVDYLDTDTRTDAGADADMGPGAGPGMDAGADAGMDGGPSSPPCNVSSRCANLAQQCMDDVKKSYETCTHQCSKSDQKCVDMCNSMGAAKFSHCLMSCEDCGHTDGCANATANCHMVLGF